LTVQDSAIDKYFFLFISKFSSLEELKLINVKVTVTDYISPDHQLKTVLLTIQNSVIEYQHFKHFIKNFSGLKRLELQEVVLSVGHGFLTETLPETIHRLTIKHGNMEYQHFFDMLNSLVGLKVVVLKLLHIESLDHDNRILGRSPSIFHVEVGSFTLSHVSYSRFFDDVINCFPHLKRLYFNKIPVGGEELTSMLHAGFEKRAGLKYLKLDSCNLNAANFPLILE